MATPSVVKVNRALAHRLGVGVAVGVAQIGCCALSLSRLRSDSILVPRTGRARGSSST